MKFKDHSYDVSRMFFNLFKPFYNSTKGTGPFLPFMIFKSSRKTAYKHRLIGCNSSKYVRLELV